MLDTVALPGALSSTLASGDVELLGLAMEEITSLRRAETGNELVHQDLKWCLASRTSLHQVTTSATLLTCVQVLCRAQDKAIKCMMATLKSILATTGWPQVTQDAWSYSGYITRMVRDSVANYLALHNHLLQMSLLQQWEWVGKEVSHHVSKLETIRAMSGSRLQALCGLHAHLHDGCKANWCSSKLQMERNLDLATQLDTISAGPPISGPGREPCPKCSTLVLHAGGLSRCPWRNKSNANTKKSAKKALLKWSGDDVPPSEG